MVLSDIIALLALLVSIASIIISLLSDIQYSKLLVFNEYTKRFQEIVSKFYTDPTNSTHHRLYFDLCCLEYFLKEEKLVPLKLWKSWVHEMKQIMKNGNIRTSWEEYKRHYDKQEDFKTFFETEIITQSITNKK